MFAGNLFHKIIKIPLILYTFYVLLFGVFQMNMDMNSMDGKVNCPFGGHSMAICQMNPMEHIEEWQSMFTMLPDQNTLSLVLIIFAFLVLSRLKFWNKFSISNLPVLFARVRFTLSNNFKTFNPLQEAFSNGILNPKLF